VPEWKRLPMLPIYKYCQACIR